MIIDVNKKFIWFHIPRTGGTTIRSIFEPLHDRQRVKAFVPESNPYTEWDPPDADFDKYGCHNGSGLTGLDRISWPYYYHPNHIDATYLRSDFPYHEYEEICVVVRNPWDRLVSYYHNLYTDDPQHLDPRDPRRGEKNRFLFSGKFEDFVEKVLDNWKEYPEHQTEPDQLFAKNQLDWIRPLENLENINFKIYRYEDMKENIAHFMDHWVPQGWRAARVALPEVPHENKSTNRKGPYQSYYPEALRKKLNFVFEEEMQRFGYKF